MEDVGLPTARPLPQLHSPKHSINILLHITTLTPDLHITLFGSSLSRYSSWNMATEDSQDIPMGSPPEPPAEVDQEPKYGGYSRFEVELEVCLLSHLVAP